MSYKNHFISQSTPLHRKRLFMFLISGFVLTLISLSFFHVALAFQRTEAPFYNIDVSLDGGHNNLTLEVDGNAAGAIVETQCPGGEFEAVAMLNPYLVHSENGQSNRATYDIEGDDGASLSGTVAVSQTSPGVFSDCSDPRGTGKKGNFAGTPNIVVSSLPNDDYRIDVTVCANQNGTVCTLKSANFTINRAGGGAPTVDLDVRRAGSGDSYSENSITINPGQGAELRWTTSGSPQTCTASGNWSGSKAVGGGNETRNNLNPPPNPYTYTITCTKPSFPNAVSTVTVNFTGGGPACTFEYNLTADKTTVTPGETLTFTTAVSNVDNCTDNWRHRIDKEAPYSGDWDYDQTGTQRSRTFTTSYTVPPYTVPGTYVAQGDILNVTAGVGAQDTLTINVVAAGGPPTVNIKARPVGVGDFLDGPIQTHFGTNTELQWVTTGPPTSCEAVGVPPRPGAWDELTDPNPGGGTKVLASEQDRTFRITCTNAQGSDVDEVLVQKVGTINIQGAMVGGAPIEAGGWTLTGPSGVPNGSGNKQYIDRLGGSYQLIDGTPPPGLVVVSVEPVGFLPLNTNFPVLTFTITYTNAYALTTSVVGNGTVTSNPVGITCPGDCTENYVSGSSVTLTATAGPGSTFTNWTGHCSGTNPITSVVMSEARSCTATFTQAPALKCTPAPNPVEITQTVVFTGDGGVSPYNWVAPGGNPGAGTGAEFSTSYTTEGLKTVTISDGIGSPPKTCTVQVFIEPTFEVRPSSRQIGIGEIAEFEAYFDPDGAGPQAEQNVTEDAATEWESLNPSVATLEGDGLYKGVRRGTTGARATYPGTDPSTATLVVATECSDDDDNDGDGDVDRDDAGCHTDGDPGNQDTYDPDDNSEDSDQLLPQCSDGLDNDGDGFIDFAGGDPGCVSGEDNNEQDLDIEEF